MSDYKRYKEDDEAITPSSTMIEEGNFQDELKFAIWRSWEIGKLKIKYRLNRGKERIYYKVWLEKVKIGQGRLDKDNPSRSTTGGSDSAKATLCLHADFTKKQLNLDYKYCVKECDIIPFPCRWYCQEDKITLMSW